MAAAMAAMQRRGTALSGVPPLRFILLFGAAFSEHPRHLEAFLHGRVGLGPFWGFCGNPLVKACFCEPLAAGSRPGNSPRRKRAAASSHSPPLLSP
jgi:hypothetical protein